MFIGFYLIEANKIEELLASSLKKDSTGRWPDSERALDECPVLRETGEGTAKSLRAALHHRRR